MVKTEPFWPKRAHMSASWAHKGPYGSVWAHMGPAQAHNVRETVLEIKILEGKRGAVLTHHVLTYHLALTYQLALPKSIVCVPTCFL